MGSDKAWLKAMATFYRRHRDWLDREAARRVDKMLLERLTESTVEFTIDGDEGIGVQLRWYEADGAHVQRLAHIGARELIDADARHFGGDCDMGRMA